MVSNNEEKGLTEVGDRLVMKRTDDPSIAPLIERAKAKGWKCINIDGNNELKRAVWLEASMNEIEVKGYAPTPEDKTLLQQMKQQRSSNKGTGITLHADEIARDYVQRVIPYLEKRHEELKRRRLKAGITTTELDRAYGLNMPSGYQRELDDKYYRAKGALLRAVEAKEYFVKLGHRSLVAKQSFEDGVARFVPTDPVRGLREGYDQRFGVKRER